MGFLGLLSVLVVLLALILYCWDLLVGRKQPSGLEAESTESLGLQFPQSENGLRSMCRNEIEEKIERGFPYAYIVARNQNGRVELVHIEYLVCGNDVSILTFAHSVPEIESFSIGSVIWIAKKMGGFDIWVQPEEEMSEMQWVEWRAAKRILLLA